MPSNQIQSLETLLGETEAAHGAYETTELNGVYDQDWPRWYATWAVDHGIGELLGRGITVDELATLLARGWDDMRQAGPDSAEPWAAAMARRLAVER